MKNLGDIKDNKSILTKGYGDSNYAPSSHNHPSSNINAMTGYSKPSSTSAIATTDTLNGAIGKIEKSIDIVKNDYATLSSKQNVSSATLTDSADGNIAQIKMYGKSYKSANLLDVSNASTWSKSRCTLTENNGVLTMTATGTDAYIGEVAYASDTSYTSNLGTLVNVKDISSLTISVSNSAINSCLYTPFNSEKKSVSQFVRVTLTNGVATINVSNCDYVAFRFGVSNSVSGTSYSFTVMLNSGTTALAYEPYGLIMAKGEVESGNKNIAEVIKCYPHDNGTLVGGNYTSALFYGKSGQTITVSADTKNRSTLARCDAKPSIGGAYTELVQSAPYTYTLTKDGWYVWYICNALTDNVQVEIGSSATDYIEHVSSSISAYETLGNNYLLSVSDVKDELCVNADGTGVRTPKCKIIDLGSCTWSKGTCYYTDANALNGVVVPAYSVVGDALCSKYIIDSASKVNTGEVDGLSISNDGRIRVYDSSIFDSTDASAFKTAMSGIYLIVQLATVTPQTLTASQVQSLLALETYKAHTDIVADCTVDLSYYKDNANGQSVADVDSRINKIEASKIDKTRAGINEAINLLDSGNATPQDADYMISQYANGGTTNMSFVKRPMSALWNYIKSKGDTTYALSKKLNNCDLNTITTSGFYIGTDNGTYTNKPTQFGSGGFGLLVISSTPNYYVQIAYRASTQTTVRRFCNNNVWSNWVEDKLTDTTYSDATQSAHGLMSTDDKIKLDGITIYKADDCSTYTTDDGACTPSAVKKAVTTFQTDAKVEQAVSTSANWRNILLKSSEYAAPTTDVTTTTDKTYVAKGVAVQPYTGTLRATKYNVNDKVTLSYDTTNECLNFTFN